MVCPDLVHLVSPFEPTRKSVWFHTPVKSPAAPTPAACRCGYNPSALRGGGPRARPGSQEAQLYRDSARRFAFLRYSPPLTRNTRRAHSRAARGRASLSLARSGRPGDPAMDNAIPDCLQPSSLSRSKAKPLDPTLCSLSHAVPAVNSIGAPQILCMRAAGLEKAGRFW